MNHPVLVYLAQGIVLAFSATSMPGPFQAFLLAQTSRHGLKRTLPMTLAPLITDGPIIAAMLFLLGNCPAGFVRGLQIVGGLFLLFLAKEAFVALKSPVEVTSAASGRQTFAQAIAMNFLSPGPYIFWSTITGPILLKAWAESPFAGAGFLLGFYVTLIGALMVFTILASAAINTGQRSRKVLAVISAGALFLFGLYQLWTGVFKG